MAHGPPRAWLKSMMPKAHGCLTILAVSSGMLWHGDIHLALEKIRDLEDDVDGLEPAYPNLGRFKRAMHEFAVYIAENAGGIINYGERFRSGGRISTAFAELRSPRSPGE